MNDRSRKLLIQSGLKDPRTITDKDTFDSVYMNFSFIKLIALVSESCAQLVSNHTASYNKIVKSFELGITPNNEPSISYDTIKATFDASTKKQIPSDGDFVVLSRAELLSYTDAILKL